MFSAMKNLHSKAKAATIVQNLLELPQQQGLFSEASHKLANEMVTLVFNSNPKMFNGSRGQRPHDITFAASALAHAIKRSGSVSMMTIGFTSCLDTIIKEVSENEFLYPLTQLDRILLAECFEVLDSATEAFNNSILGKEMDMILK